MIRYGRRVGKRSWLEMPLWQLIVLCWIGLPIIAVIVVFYCLCIFVYWMWGSALKYGIPFVIRLWKATF